jgi:hypothetical protein
MSLRSSFTRWFHKSRGRDRLGNQRRMWSGRRHGLDYCRLYYVVGGRWQNDGPPQRFIWGSREVRLHLPQELSIACGETPRAIHPHNILVIVANLHDCAGPVPSGGIVASLVLNTADVTDLEGK